MDPVRLAASDALFATPLLKFTVPDAPALNARLAAEALAMRAASPGVQVSNQKGWHSEVDFFLRPEPACAELRGHMLEAIRQATQKVSPGFDFVRNAVQFEGWININGKGGFNTPHDHPGWAWSGCYYVSVPEVTEGRSGMIEFLDPRSNVAAVTVQGAGCFQPKARLRPSPGDLLVFPSYLNHWVYPNEEPEERISIAFNARLVARPA